MKRFLVFGLAVGLVACSENPTQPGSLSPKGPNLTVLTPSGVDLLVCSEGIGTGSEPDGTCTLSADHKKGVLDNTSSDPDGDASSVYSLDNNPYGEFLSNITELSYSYKNLNFPVLLPQPGELSYNIPIDTDGDGDTDDFAFVDAAYCGVKSSASVNIVTAANCKIYDQASNSYANWAAFVAAHQFAKVSLTDYYIFIISERVGDTPGPAGRGTKWEISNVKFGKTGLVCFDGPREATIYGGLCTPSKDFMSATLDNLESDVDGGYSGVYSKETTGYGLFLSAIKDLSFKYTPLTTPQLGELIFRIPISNNGTGSTSFTAVVDVATCKGNVGANGAGSVNITKDLACDIFDGTSHYGNWAAFAAAYPNARTATDHSSTDRTNWITLIASRAALGAATRFIVSNLKWGHS